MGSHYPIRPFETLEDFKECVRCNVCETKLIEKAGVCKHDMEDVRPRLVQLKVSGVQGASGG